MNNVNKQILHDSDFRRDEVADEGDSKNLPNDAFKYKGISLFNQSNRKQCITNRNALKDWIQKEQWDMVIQFQPMSDAVKTMQLHEFTNNFRATSVRRVQGVGDTGSYNKYLHNNFPVATTRTIARQQVDATEIQKRVLGTFWRELKKSLRSGIKMMSIVEQYADKKAHSAVFMSGVGMNTIPDSQILDAAKKARLVVGQDINGHLIFGHGDNQRHVDGYHYKNKTHYLMKTLFDWYLEETHQLANSQDVWGMSNALYNKFLIEQGMNVIHTNPQKHMTPPTRKYANVSKDVSRFGPWRNTNNQGRHK